MLGLLECLRYSIFISSLIVHCSAFTVFITAEFFAYQDIIFWPFVKLD